MTTKLKLALLTAKLSPAAGGLASSVPALAKGLGSYGGIDVTVLGTRDPSSPEAWHEWGDKVEAFAVCGPAMLQYAPHMQSHLASIGPDVVDVQGLWTWPSVVNLRHYIRYGTPYLVTPRGMLDPWARKNSSWKKSIVTTLYEGRHLHNAACLRATAEMEAGHFRSMGLRNPIAIVPNSVKIPNLKLREISSRRRVLLLSRIHPKKGIDYLLRAWSRLEPQYLDWDLLIVGPDENGHTGELKKLVKQLGLLRVNFRGLALDSEKQDLYRNSDLFVLPTHAENFGLVIAEALAQELPVITTRNAPWEGLVSKRCGWWIPLDEDCLVEAMTEAIAMPSNALRVMGQNGRVWMQRSFEANAVSEKMREVYNWVSRGGTIPNCIES